MPKLNCSYSWTLVSQSSSGNESLLIQNWLPETSKVGPFGKQGHLPASVPDSPSTVLILESSGRIGSQNRN